MGTMYARNRNAVAICNRSGVKMLRSDMVEDGYIKGLLVHPEWYDPAHPQEQPFDPDEPIAIYKPAPDLVPSPPASVLGIAGNVLTWTQPNPPASTVVNWQVWRLRPGTDANFLKIATVTPAAPGFIQTADLIARDGIVTQTRTTAANVGQQSGTYTDAAGVSGYQYYIVTLTADTSNTQSPGVGPNGLISPPSNTVTHA